MIIESIWMSGKPKTKNIIFSNWRQFFFLLLLFHSISFYNTRDIFIIILFITVTFQSYNGFMLQFQFMQSFVTQNRQKIDINAISPLHIIRNCSSLRLFHCTVRVLLLYRIQSGGYSKERLYRYLYR